MAGSHQVCCREAERSGRRGEQARAGCVLKRGTETRFPPKLSRGTRTPPFHFLTPAMHPFRGWRVGGALKHVENKPEKDCPGSPRKQPPNTWMLQIGVAARNPAPCRTPWKDYIPPVSANKRCGFNHGLKLCGEIERILSIQVGLEETKYDPAHHPTARQPNRPRVLPPET